MPGKSCWQVLLTLAPKQLAESHNESVPPKDVRAKTRIDFVCCGKIAKAGTTTTAVCVQGFVSLFVCGHVTAAQKTESRDSHNASRLFWPQSYQTGL